MLNLKELIEACNGKYINGNLDYIPKNYVIDSRIINKGDFFVPIIGENTDGHSYIIDTVKKGSIGFFINKNTKNKKNIIDESIKINSDICIIEVEDTFKALYNAGKKNREKNIDIPVVAITGSVGKTSTREMVSSVLNQKYKVLTTEKNHQLFKNLFTNISSNNKYDFIIDTIYTEEFRHLVLDSTKKYKSGRKRIMSIFKTGLFLLHKAFNSMIKVRLPFTFILYDL